MSAPRTVTVPTTDHGDVTMPEPAWCVGHAGLRPECRVDLNHLGPEHQLGPVGSPLFVALLSQYPFGSSRCKTGLYVEPLAVPRTHDPADLDELAASLVESAAQLRHLARELAALRATEDGRR